MSEETRLPLSVKQVNEAYAAISSLIKSDKDNKFVFRSRVRIKLSANLRKLNPIRDDYEAERLRLVQELGEVTDKEKGTLTVKPENQEKFITQITESLNAPTDVVLDPITDEDLFGCTEDEEAKGTKANQIDIDLHYFMKKIGLVK